ncbi:gamma-sarcoglycan isoform X1 [Diorhabda sublineata]|uniref:gamma-sarcoglycan isoform X1 n=2 Tax=Diorhabda sublineata TaxID=1163346 RepID=UPI0024E0E9CA|nr:gamma-sarcoglycan isoform X1 [Diorhabda sublineata]
MSADEDLFLNGTGKTKSIYQQSSTGEKHVLFYPTSSLPSVGIDNQTGDRNTTSRKLQKQIPGHQNHRNSYNSIVGMKKSEGPSPAVGDTQESHGDQSRLDPDISDSKYNFRIGIYGWRKKCLYFLILVLLIMVVVNLALTLWVLKVMEFSSEGMGQLKIVSGGLKLEGKTFVLDSLIASSIKSRSYQPIVIESTKNLTLRARNTNGYVDSSIVLGNEKLECLTNNFKITDDRGSLLFSADRREVIVGSETLRVIGKGGTSFSGSIQTTLVRAEAGHELRLESPTRSLDIKAAKEINIESRGGKIRTLSFNDISLHSEVGAIKLETRSLLMPLIPTAKVTSRAASSGSYDIYQLCVCESGKLFLASPHLVCASENDDRLCR